MFALLNKHCLNIEKIVAFYPCDKEGKYLDNHSFTFVRFDNGDEFLYEIDFYELVEIIKKRDFRF